MTTMQQIAEHYNATLKRLAESTTLPLAQPEGSAVHISHTTQICETESAILEKVHALKPTAGWVCRQSSQEKTDATSPALTLQAGNRIVSGEWVNDTHSLHVRQHPQGWYVTQYAETTGEPNAIKVVRFQLQVEQGQKMKYAVYFKADAMPHEAATGLREQTSRFLGWE